MLTEADPNLIEVIAEGEAGATAALTRRLAAKYHDHVQSFTLYLRWADRSLQQPRA